MKTYQFIAALMLIGASVTATDQQAAALPGDSVSGGGQILQPDSDYKISFAGWANHIGAGQFEGELQVNFHRVSNPDLVKSKFHGAAVTNLNFFDSDNGSCNAAMNMTVEGTLDGESGYSVIFRAGDAGAPGNTNAAEPFDTARIQLFNGTTEIYDTHDGDFDDQSNCVGTARTGLDRGNITIEYP